jgi:hypoxanthine-guanine phosphoribosyltransferase
MKTFISYNNYKKVFDKAINKLLEQIDFRGQNLKIQLAGVEKGGVVPLIMLNYFLQSKFPNLKIKRRYLNISFYDEKCVDLSTIREIEDFSCDLTIIIDDLLDKGLTFDTIYSNLKAKNVVYIFLYDKQNYSPECKKILAKLKKQKSVIIGKREMSGNWLCFWYDFQEI